MSRKGVKQSKEHIRKRVEKQKNKKHTKERIQNISKATKGLHSGANHYLWKGERYEDKDGYVILYVPTRDEYLSTDSLWKHSLGDY